MGGPFGRTEPGMDSLERVDHADELEWILSGVYGDRYVDVLKRRFMLGQSLMEVAKALGCTRDRVRQIEYKALEMARSKAGHG